MKVWNIFLLFLITSSCQGQDNNGVITYPKEKMINTEKFDVKSFKKHQEEQQKLPVTMGDPTTKITEVNGIRLMESSGVSSKNNKEYFRSSLPPAPALFFSESTFDENGKITETIDQVFIGTLFFRYGVNKIYDDRGVHIKTIDFSQPYNNLNITLDNLLEILTREEVNEVTFDKDAEYQIRSRWNPDTDKITSEVIIEKLNKGLPYFGRLSPFEKYFLNPFNREDVERLGIDYNDVQNHWVVVKDFSSMGKIRVVVDATSGKIKEKTFYF